MVDVDRDLLKVIDFLGLEFCTKSLSIFHSQYGSPSGPGEALFCFIINDFTVWMPIFGI